MKTFKWTVPSAHHSDPRSMNRDEYARWARIRARGLEWYVVQKGLLMLMAVPGISWLSGGPGFDAQVATFSWFGGLCAGTLVWFRHEARFERARDAGMRAAGDEVAD